MLIIKIFVLAAFVLFMWNLPNISGISSAERKEYERKEKQAIIRGEISEAEHYRRMAGK